MADAGSGAGGGSTQIDQDLGYRSYSHSEKLDWSSRTRTYILIGLVSILCSLNHDFPAIFLICIAASASNQSCIHKPWLEGTRIAVVVASGDLSTTWLETGDEVEVAEVEVVAEVEEVHDT